MSKQGSFIHRQPNVILISHHFYHPSDQLISDVRSLSSLRSFLCSRAKPQIWCNANASGRAMHFLSLPFNTEPNSPRPPSRASDDFSRPYAFDAKERSDRPGSGAHGKIRKKEKPGTSARGASVASELCVHVVCWHPTAPGFHLVFSCSHFYVALSLEGCGFFLFFPHFFSLFHAPGPSQRRRRRDRDKENESSKAAVEMESATINSAKK